MFYNCTVYDVNCTHKTLCK